MINDRYINTMGKTFFCSLHHSSSLFIGSYLNAYSQLDGLKSIIHSGFNLRITIDSLLVGRKHEKRKYVPVEKVAPTQIEKLLNFSTGSYCTQEVRFMAHLRMIITCSPYLFKENFYWMDGAHKTSVVLVVVVVNTYIW